MSLSIAIVGINCTIAQVYKIQDTTLNVFTINDTLKYFEFYTPEYPHSNVGCGIISRSEQNVFVLKYADASNYNKFKMVFKGNSVGIIRTLEHGYIPYSLERNANKLVITSDTLKQNVFHFYLNYPISYKAQYSSSIKVYEYPCFESMIKKMSFNKGSKIEEKWSVGLYNKHSPVKDKTWIAAVCEDKFLGWFLLSDIDKFFKEIDEKN